MPSQEAQQPQVQSMELPTVDAPTVDANGVSTQQPKPVEQMNAEPVSMRGGGDVCCGICAGLACFECLECCC